MRIGLGDFLLTGVDGDQIKWLSAPGRQGAVLSDLF